MKRLVVCCDGTWNRPDQKHPTNVVKMSRAIAPSGADGIPQVVFYDRGSAQGIFSIASRVVRLARGSSATSRMLIDSSCTTTGTMTTSSCSDSAVAPIRHEAQQA